MKCMESKWGGHRKNSDFEHYVAGDARFAYFGKLLAAKLHDYSALASFPAPDMEVVLAA